MIRYSFLPDRAFLRRGALRTYFAVAQDWRRFSFTEIIAVAAIVMWQLLDKQMVLAEFGFPAVVLAALLCCALTAVIIRGVNIAVTVASLWFGVKPGVVATDVTILPGRLVRCQGAQTHVFAWDQLRVWRRYSDMYVLLFATETDARPDAKTPVFVSRQHLSMQDASFAAALTAHMPTPCPVGVTPQPA